MPPATFSETRKRRLAAWVPPCLLAAMASVLIFSGLGSYSVVNGDEAFYHAVAVHMVESGDWLHLYFRGEHVIYPTFMNAPLQYWARAVLISVFGDNYWTMRFLSALFAVAAILATYRLGLWSGGRRTAFIAAFMQMSSVQFIYLHCARSGELEPVIAFAIAMSAYLFMRDAHENRGFTRHFLAVLLMTAMKTPLLLPAVAADLLCFALSPSSRRHFRRWLFSAAVILPFGFLWHALRLPVLWEPFQQVLNTMASEASGSGWRGDIAGNALFYAKTLLFGALPWSLIFAAALAAMAGPLARSIASARKLKTEASDSLSNAPAVPTSLSSETLLVVYAYTVAVFAFYLGVAKHYPWYVIPAYPFLCVISALWIDRSLHRCSRATLAAFSLIAAAAVWLKVDVAGFNPFAERAFVIDMSLGVRSLAGWHADGALSLALTLGLSAALFFAVSSLAQAVLSAVSPAISPAASSVVSSAEITDRGAGVTDRGAGFVRPRLVVAPALLALLLGAYAVVRVAAPLRYLGYQSEQSRLHDEMRRALAQGQTIDYPLRVPGAAYVPARYYFGDDFELVPRFLPDGSYELWLFEKGDLSVLDLSVSHRHLYSQAPRF